MKKLFSILLSFAMVLGMGSVALAANKEEDKSNIEIYKNYILTNEGISPFETFDFTIKAESVSDAADGVNTSTYELPIVRSVNFEAGSAIKDTGNEIKGTKAQGTISVKLPEYNSVGIYTYIINEVSKNNVGVTYYKNNIKLVVTVTQGKNGFIRTAAVHTEDPISPSYVIESKKSDEFSNYYSAGTLEVKKNVSGNLGDKSKKFKVDVTFDLPKSELDNLELTYKTLGHAITYGGGKEITDSDFTNGKVKVTIEIAHSESVKFENIPYGVSYEVKEHDYTTIENGGYKNAQYYINETKVGAAISVINTIDEEHNNDLVSIENTKQADVDTGISLDSIPYILLLGFAVLGMGALFFRRRQNTSF